MLSDAAAKPNDEPAIETRTRVHSDILLPDEPKPVDQEKPASPNNEPALSVP